MFTNEVFISYAHADNQALTSDQEGWISSLHRSLEVRLAQLRGTRPRIWRDPKLQGNDYFADEIEKQFPQVATLISVLSPRYVRSDWCRRELRAFSQANLERVRVGEKSRIFKIIKTPIARQEHPEELRELLGYEFYTLEQESGRVREFNHMAGPELERQYWTALDDLAQDLAQILNLIEEQPPVPAAEGPIEESTAPSIYLAATTRDLKSERDELKRDLLQRGVTVLPAQALPFVASKLEQAVSQDLARCRLSIHLLGRDYGVVPEGATRSIIELQNERAVERVAVGDFTRLIWIPPGLEVADERQQTLLRQIRKGDGAQEGAELLETTLEELKEVVQQALCPAPEEPQNGRGDSKLVRVYLICDRTDLEQVSELEDFLFGCGLEVILPAFEGAPSEMRQDHEENLSQCDAVIFYYGDVNELWLRAKLREAQKVAGFKRSEPLKAKAIYVSSPAHPRKERLRTHEALVIHGVEGFRPALFDPFLRDLGA